MAESRPADIEAAAYSCVCSPPCKEACIKSTTRAEGSTSVEKQSLTELQRNLSLDPEKEKGSVLYLAYGSNLSDETFLKNRGIRPLSSTNVLVPELRLTFDLAGIPYNEPCFANSARRDPNHPSIESEPGGSDLESAQLLEEGKEARKRDAWKKGLVGVVYEVTPFDYAHIIATEGGGSSYTDILVDCYPLDSSDLSIPVPWEPKSAPFKAHTLFAPTSGEDLPKDGGRIRRPDPSYAQASARYLKLLTDGAQQRGLPHEYQEYLQSLQPYTITTQKQRLGQWIMSSFWLPIIFFVFGLQRKYSNKKGRAPAWLRLLAASMFRAVWLSYDQIFKRLFGDGERTMNGPDGKVGIALPENGYYKYSIDRFVKNQRRNSGHPG